MSDLPHGELRRTARQMNLPGFGLEQQNALHNAHVFVIGAGGLGCPVMQTLAATGVGRISVIDDDTVNISNIHRQILFGAEDVGRPKVEVAGERLRQLQPGIELGLYRERFTPDNALGLLEGVDVLIDGSDTFATKFLAADAAELSGTPLVWGSVLRYRGDVALWWTGPGAPADGAGLRDLYPTQPAADSVPDCATAGVLGVTTSVVGGLMATEAVKHLTGVGESRVGRLHIYDALGGSIQRFTVPRDPARALVDGFSEYEPVACEVNDAGGEGVEKLLLQPSIDVREPHEKALRDVARPGVNLPTSEWEEHPERARELVERFDEGDQVTVYCASGARSGRFVERFGGDFAARGITLHNLPGGANAHGSDI
ncbi:ThiF family adenylyltransferase [Corynebacterium timonense]|uniref:ThiF family adenylyltransferase n=1 Tax=Corynebacterium timonense TaxID=441500 RepID=UPI0005937863|nr:ThiF family adenylyltransferase [Corynebacterium timonense]